MPPRIGLSSFTKAQGLCRATPTMARTTRRSLASLPPRAGAGPHSSRSLWAAAAVATVAVVAVGINSMITPTTIQCASEPRKGSQISFIPTPTIDLDDQNIPLRDRMVAHIQSLQETITKNLEQLEPSGKKFKSSYYLRDSKKGFGDSRVLQDGETFEKAGCNISVIKSTLSPAAVRQMRSERFDWWDGKSELPYFVAGCSLVVHPRNPHAPTIHFNYRYFEIQDSADPDGPPKAWWFGGGTDLTPSYLYEDDARHFHILFKETCDRHDPSYYAKFKEWCDRYFFIPHRGESRGIGGIFMDDLNDRNQEDLFKFIRDCSNTFLPAYYPIVQNRKDQPFSEEEKRWQQLRRGRYCEFNLVHDRGTKFGLAMKEPRTESILMSLPLTARWEYEPEVGTQAGTKEKKLMDVLKNPVEWAS